LELKEKVELALFTFVADYDGPSGDGERKVTIQKVMVFKLVGRGQTGTEYDFVVNWYNLLGRSIFSIFGY
jgi:hypothetical protein